MTGPCPHCRHPVTVEPQHLGSPVICPHCSQPFTPPRPQPARTPRREASGPSPFASLCWMAAALLAAILTAASSFVSPLAVPEYVLVIIAAYVVARAADRLTQR